MISVQICLVRRFHQNYKKTITINGLVLSFYVQVIFLRRFVVTELIISSDNTTFQ